MSPITRFPDLDQVLRHLVTGVASALGDDLVGVYLQGSFALGEADIHSDVDFIVVTERTVTDGQLARLQAMHARLHRLPTHWARHLEGSYVPRTDIRRRGSAPCPFPYLDNGSDTLIRDAHCDTQVTRWIVRERGIALSGPTPATLIDPIGPDQLREEMDGMLDSCLRWAREPTPAGRMSRWKQTFLVTLLCRESSPPPSPGSSMSKRAALERTRDGSPGEWRDLITRAIDGRPDRGAACTRSRRRRGRGNASHSQTGSHHGIASIRV